MILKNLLALKVQTSKPIAIYIIAALSLVLVGCSSVVRNKDIAGEIKDRLDPIGSNFHQIYIGSNGELIDSETDTAISPELEVAYVDNIFLKFNTLNDERAKRKLEMLEMTIFIHGGLNSFETANNRVTRDAQQMINDGKYPLFISWDSGFPGNYRDHLFFLRRGIHTPERGIPSSPLVFLEDVARSIIHIPESTYNVVVGQMALHNKIDSDEERKARDELAHLTFSKEFSINNSENRNGHPFYDDAMKVNPIKVLTAPLIDGFGLGAWNSMLRRTDLVLRKNADFSGVARDVLQRDSNAKPTQVLGSTAVAKFLRKWEITYRKAASKPRVNLIGHSMGTIIANNIVAKYPEINFSNIVYMAAATRMKDIENIISPYMRRNETTRFYNLTLHPERDLNEAHYFDTIPRGSLLVWIDQTLATTNSFQDRTAGYWYNLVLAANQIFSDEDTRKRVYLTKFGVRDGSPQLHGDFSKCPFWRKEFWTFTSYDMNVRTEDLKCDNFFPRVSNLPISSLDDLKAQH